MRKLIVSEFISLDGVVQAPGGADEDRDGGFAHGGWTQPYWHDDIGSAFFAVMKDEEVRALKAKPGKDIITDGSSRLVQTLLAHDLVDELHLLLYPIVLGGGKRIFPEKVDARFTLRGATPYPTGVVGLHYVRQGQA
jgi:dihydrofolate reductase